MPLRRILALFAVCAALVAASLPAPAQEKTKQGFVKKVFKNADGHESPYIVFVPHDYDGSKPQPVILFLHGAGETKGGKKAGKQPVEVGLGPAIRQREKSFPFITIIPQAEGLGWQAESANTKRALAMLEEVRKEYKTDPKRTYLTGLSMGGYGTWSLALAHPEMWAAIAPICGKGDPAKAAAIKDLPCWCFHGDKDTAVNVAGSRDMIAALKKAGGNPKYTEYPGVGHNSWDQAYGTDELYSWLLEQKKN
jgi:predicted peptidase